MLRATARSLIALAALLLPASLATAQAAPPSLAFPAACQVGRSCEIQNYVDRDPGPGAKDYRCGAETYEGHNGVDIRLPDMAAQKRGVQVLAAAPGRVLRLRDGVPDISIRAPGAPPLNGQDCGNGMIIDHGGGWETQYCHMARGSLLVKPGQQVAAGTPLGRIGLSGDTEYPHLHITVRHTGKVVDPFAPDMADLASCRGQPPLWSAGALAQLGYKAGAVLNTGFAAGPVKMEDVEAGAIAPPGADAPYLVAYGRGIDLQAGDAVVLELRSPTGAVLAQSPRQPLDHSKAQHLAFVGKKRPPTGWPPGIYRASYRVIRQGKPAIARDFEIKLGG